MHVNPANAKHKFKNAFHLSKSQMLRGLLSKLQKFIFEGC